MVPMWCSFLDGAGTGKYGDQGARCIPRQVTRCSGYPSAALASSTFAGPRSTYAAPTAMTAPVTAAIAGSSLGIVDGHIGSQAAGGVHRRALERPAHRAPGPDVRPHG